MKSLKDLINFYKESNNTGDDYQVFSEEEMSLLSDM